MLTLAIAGCTGRMGRALVEAVIGAPDLSLGGVLEQSGSVFLGRDPGDWLGSPLGLRITSDVSQALSGSSVLIDFTRPQATLSHLEACVRHRRAIVIGTTGFAADEKAQIVDASRHIPIVFAPNMSVGVTVVLALLEQAARLLPTDYDVEITEAHHRYKVDAPSGTALRMGEVVAAQRGWNLADVAVYGRSGVTGARPPKTVGFATVRGGDVVGDHTVSFMAEGERVEITHKASSRATFALGALRAARFVAQQAPGLFDMRAVLGL
ncbi:MAG: 4-hydroxy-tetrahydrodipicolinate reductase [Ferrovum sp.]|nr:4-hydroxy-tetrahydrodipicolinate reductase [Ferrovum sp.]NDU87341.1 4-hydroxy-tetrahydrodipicolinate reductase [Ferrovum sp.]